MARFGFSNGVGYYKSQSSNLDAEICKNFYVESIESGWGKSAFGLYGTPGSLAFCTAMAGGVSRGCIEIPGPPQRLFWVVGPNFYEIMSNGTVTLRNAANQFTGIGRVSMASSPLQILIVDNFVAYCYNLASNTFQALQTYSIGLGGLALGMGYVAAAGDNYTVGDVLTPQSSNGTGGTYRVASVFTFSPPPHSQIPPVHNGISTLTILTEGSGYMPAPNVPLTGGTGGGAQVNISTTSVAPGSGMLANPVQCGYCDGFFLVTFYNSQQVQCSQPLDASTWDPTQVTSISVFPDNIVSMIVDHRQVWLWGSTKSQVYYDSGNTFPFDPVPSGFIESGAAAAFAQVRMDNSVFWLELDERGAAVARRANGYTPLRISNHAVEYAWQQYSTISDAVGFSWQYSGHSFWTIYFPTAGATWTYDAATNQWHERTSYNASSGQFGAYFGNCHAFCFGQHLMGSWQDAHIYAVGPTYYTENGNAIQRVRSSPYIFREHHRLRHMELELDLEVGLGPQPPLTDGAGNPREPQLQLTWSDDQGKTWSMGRVLNCGFAGEYYRRVIARMLGKSRGRIYKVVCTDPIPWRFADAYLRATPSFDVTERLATQIGKMG